MSTYIVDVTMSMARLSGGPSAEEPSASGAGRPSPVLQRKPTSSTAGGGTWAPQRPRRLVAVSQSQIIAVTRRCNCRRLRCASACARDPWVGTPSVC